MTGISEPMWLKVRLDCPEITLEAVTDLLGVVSGSAVEQTPVNNGQSTVTGFFRFEQETEQEEILQQLDRKLDELFRLYELAPPEPHCSVMKNEDWATSWQQFFTPFAVVPGLVIKPGWEDYTAAPDEQVIEMDPGMAFGTGQHASTRLALGLIRACFQDDAYVLQGKGRPEKILDIGTGTGILAMAAALFGDDRVIAMDNDPEAVRVAAENIAHNNLQEQITVSGVALSRFTGRFDLICANIIHDVLVEMAPEIARLLAEQGSVVLAGILAGKQEENIISVYEALQLTVRSVAYEDEWAALLLDA
ncbi:MAG: 50S ribosomal protein L11 methyltransferase [Candidatus Electrothrix sp. YB6]